jgi:hypothetical protein
MSLQMLCVKSIIYNNVDYTILSDYHQYTIDFEIHKMKFYETLYILNTIYDEMSNIKNLLLLKVQPVCKDVNEGADDEKYKFIFVKFLYKNKSEEFKGTRFIQEITDIEFE